MADPEIVTEARARLGARLAALRQAAGYTQESFARLTMYGRSTVANVERGRQRVQRDFWERCDTILHADPSLATEYDAIERLRADHWRTAARSTSVALAQDHGALMLVEPSFTLDTTSDDDQAYRVLTLPAGRYFAGTDLDVRVFPAVVDGRVLVRIPPEYDRDPFLLRSRRGLVVGAASDRGGNRLYGLDTRHARRKIVGGPGPRLLVPAAYLLDQVTLSLLWVIANVDDALLDDDRLLADYQRQLDGYQSMARSAVSRSSVTELAAISAMWLGSDFCARHIMRNIDQVDAVPAFWTREQRGDEASAWLLFAHKYKYLEQLTARFPDGMTRAFCIPEPSVAASPINERVLVLLAMALMESFGIRCLVTHEPEYAAVDGFVLDSDRRAIVANWVGTEGIWSVDLTSSRTTIREYADAHSYVDAHSTVADDKPARRLWLVADYLGLDWATITGRCAELARYGLAGLAEPRSRLLSLDAVERACQYLGDLNAITG